MKLNLVLASLVLTACTPAGSDGLSPPRTAVGGIAGPRDGFYRGTGTLDAVQDAKRCTVGTYPKSMTITNGRAVINWRNGPITGNVAADGSIAMTGQSRQANMQPTATGYTGRVLSGFGPWCKSTLVLERADRQGPDEEP